MDEQRPESTEPAEATWEPSDDADQIRYSLTALGEAAVAERSRRPRFRGFGPCAGPVCA
jgi:hypothetical protein